MWEIRHEENVEDADKILHALRGIRILGVELCEVGQQKEAGHN